MYTEKSPTARRATSQPVTRQMSRLHPCRSSVNGRVAVLPDILHYDRSQPAAYPNGRHPQDDAFMARMNFLSHGQAGHSGLEPHKDLLTGFPYLEPPVPWGPPD